MADSKQKHKKILITGGSGNLGMTLRKLTPSIIAPDMKEMDITDAKQTHRVIKKHHPDTIIHAAAWTDNITAEKNKKAAWRVNVEGTESVASAAEGRRLIYISTDYVFDGEEGNYMENDIPNPVNFYALTKLIGEVIIKQHPNTLIIRTAFKPDGPWKYPGAFVDQWVSHDFVSNIAPEILRAVLMTRLTGVVHIAGKKTILYDLARKVSPNVKKMKRADVSVPIPKDTSLNQSKWKSISSKRKSSNT